MERHWIRVETGSGVVMIVRGEVPIVLLMHVVDNPKLSTTTHVQADDSIPDGPRLIARQTLEWMDRIKYTTFSELLEEARGELTDIAECYDNESSASKRSRY